ncbi:MAG: hypothetical protein IPH45_15065 [Bacteroidales bacterium]|nr:hypothetical protein [Bacteroidales bacterium]
MKTRNLLLTLVVLLGCNTFQYAQTLTKTQTLALFYETQAMDANRCKHLISFVLKKDSSEYNKAFKVMKQQVANYKKMKRYGTADGAMMFSIDAHLSISESKISIYGSFFYDQIMKDSEKTKDLEYAGTTYQVSKMRKSEFKKISDELKKIEEK